MKKSIILSSVAASVLAGMLIFSGCGSNSTSSEDVGGHVAIGDISAVIDANGTVSGDASVTAAEEDGGNLGGGLSSTTVTLRSASNCVDTNNVATPCEEVCTSANPCTVTVEAKCSTATDETSTLDYSKRSDIIGAWDAYNNSGNADVQAVKSDSTIVAAYSGVVTITGTGVTTCGFDFSTFIVCALSKDGVHYWNTSTNSAGYALVFVEYADGTSEWIKAPITRTSNGEENDQPFISLEGLIGKVPAKITVFSVLKVGAPATGSGSTGITGSLGG